MTRAEAMREVAQKMRDVAQRLPHDYPAAADFIGWAERLEFAARWQPAPRTSAKRQTLTVVRK